MFDLCIYSLKAGVCLVVFYLFFKLLLSRETFIRFNRFFLLGGMALAFVLPLCVVTVYRELPAMPVTASGIAPAPAPAVPEEAAFDWQSLLGVIFIAGIAAMLLRTLYSLFAVLRIVRSGRRERLADGTVLVRTRHSAAPFSWGRYIVVSEEDMALSGREILIHEQAHLRLHHSVDLLLTDLAGAFQWFNPAMWLLRRELRAIHEYEADRAVIRSGVDARDYQLLLIRKAVGGRWYSVANSFNHSKLKNRITMMLRKKSSRWAGARALFVLPLAGMGLGAFAQTAYVVSDDKVNKESVTVSVSGPDISLGGLDGQPLYLVDGQEVASLDGIPTEKIASVQVVKGGQTVETYGEKGRNGVAVITLKKEGSAKADKRSVKIDDATIVVRGSSDSASLDKVNAYFKSDEWKEAQRKIAESQKYFESDEWKAVQEQIAASATAGRVVSIRSTAGTSGANLLYLVDGVKVDDLSQVAAGQIGYMSVFKGSNSVPEQYRGQGYDGVVVITTKRAGSADRDWGISTSDRNSVWTHDGGVTQAKGSITITGMEQVPDDCLIFIDGKRSTKAEMEQIPSGKIRRMNIYKGEQAVEKFGPAARSGAIEIKTRRR